MSSRVTKVVFQRITATAIMPKRATKHSAGFDLCCDEGFTLYKWQHKLITTGIAIAIPVGLEGQIRARSGLAAQRILIPNSPGTIDADYRGEIKVLLLNVGADKFFIAGDRIAQLVITRVPEVSFVEGVVKNDTERGSGGFGSTGR